MAGSFEILPMRPFTAADLWPILTGYETREIYRVERTETDSRTLFDIHLVTVDPPYRTDYYNDFTPAEIDGYLSLLPQGYSFGAYQGGRLIGFALGEGFPDEYYTRVWEFHVLAEFRRAGVGRALMTRVIENAAHNHLDSIMLETQNTNVPAIRFYRSLGFTLDSLALAHYVNDGADPSLTAFYMKRRVTAGAV